MAMGVVDQKEAVAQPGDLLLKTVDRSAPAGVQEQQRSPATVLFIVDTGVLKLNDWHGGSVQN